MSPRTTSGKAWPRIVQSITQAGVHGIQQQLCQELQPFESHRSEQEMTKVCVDPVTNEGGSQAAAVSSVIVSTQQMCNLGRRPPPITLFGEAPAISLALGNAARDSSQLLPCCS